MLSQGSCDEGIFNKEEVDNLLEEIAKQLTFSLSKFVMN